MKEMLYSLVGYIAKIHDSIMHLNDAFEAQLSDKELHFLIIGALGILLFLIIHLIFKRLAKWSVAAISWVYTITLLVVITFGIEIGQGYTKTGAMEFADILYGLWGFVIFYAIFWIIKTVLSLIIDKLKHAAKSPYEQEDE